MTKKELKEVLKPLIKELVQEILMSEQGILAHIIKECLSATTERNVIFETKSQNKPVQNNKYIQEKQERDKERKKMLVEAAGFGSMGELNPFSGTAPLQESTISEGGYSAPSPLQGIDPQDEGVNVEQLLGGMRKFKIK